MARAKDERAVAREIADDLCSDGDAVSLRSVGSNRYTFDYDGLIHAHLLPDGWQFHGFSQTGWFAIGRA